MRHQHHPKHDLIQAEINLMPLIDVCLVLVIVLLVVFPMVKATAASPAVKKTEASTPGVLALEEPQLPVEILADGSLTVDGKPVGQAELHRVLGEIWSLTPNRPVIVKGARHVRYAQVRWVLQSVNAAGFRRAGLTADRR
ncbi:MAG: Biopolymer transport protein ExbD/TolR [Acidobacteriota bacterium]|jgi:biopolymer transport protein ExbD|nr:Biopolymer transport protein ExbD/TolR [Acidobacteriota bacterium]